MKAPKPAEIDEELAKRYGAETLEALKEQIRGRLAAEYAQATRAILKRRLMDALDARVSFELPPTLVDVEARQVAHQLWHEENPDHHGHDHDAIEPTAEHRKLAERRVRLGLLLAEIGNKHAIQVGEQEMQRAVFAQARQYPGQERQFLEFIQKNTQALQQIRAPLFEDKVVDFILELAQITEKEVGKDELQQALDALDEQESTTAAPARLRPARTDPARNENRRRRLSAASRRRRALRSVGDAAIGTRQRTAEEGTDRPMETDRTVTGFFERQRDAEAAIARLHEIGVGRDQVTMVERARPADAIGERRRAAACSGSSGRC